MRKKRKISTAYAFPGYQAEKEIKGVFGDPGAIIIRLKRQEKKRYAQAA